MGQLGKRVIEMIGERGRATINEISDHFNIDVKSAGRLLRILHREGRIEVTHGPGGPSAKALPDGEGLGQGTYGRITRRLIDEIAALGGAGKDDTSNKSLASAIEGQMSDHTLCLK